MPPYLERQRGIKDHLSSCITAQLIEKSLLLHSPNTNNPYHRQQHRIRIHQMLFHCMLWNIFQKNKASQMKQTSGLWYSDATVMLLYPREMSQYWIIWQKREVGNFQQKIQGKYAIYNFLEIQGNAATKKKVGQSLLGRCQTLDI